MSACKQVAQPQLVSFQGGGLNMDTNFSPWPRKDKVVIVMGATGTGKSRLAIDLATRRRFDADIVNSEIVNSDKMQVYQGLDIVTNKVTEEECHGVPHHLLGIADPNSSFTAADFRCHASLAMDSIVRRNGLPIIAGGSNSYIEALVNDNPDFRSKYECCFLWVDVSLPVLRSFVSERVDKMVAAGLVDEVRRIYDPEADNSRGIRQAIGVPEMDHFLRSEGKIKDKNILKNLLEAAIAKIKENTCALAVRQLNKIRRLQYRGWNLHRIDATEVFYKRGKEADEAWDHLVARPSSVIVDQFLYKEDLIMPSKLFSPDAITIMSAAVAAATR